MSKYYECLCAVTVRLQFCSIVDCNSGLGYNRYDLTDKKRPAPVEPAFVVSWWVRGSEERHCSDRELPESAASRIAAVNSSRSPSFRRYFRAPARIISERLLASELMERARIFVSGNSVIIRRVASIPSMTGMLTSMRMTSGCSMRVFETAS